MHLSSRYRINNSHKAEIKGDKRKIFRNVLVLDDFNLLFSVDKNKYDHRR